MADDTQTPTPTPPPDDPTTAALKIMQQFMPQPVQVDTTPVKRSWQSLLGEGLGGGETIPMSPADKEAAGVRALGQFGTQLMAASRYSPGQTLFSNLAQGFEGAQRGLVGSEQMSAGMLGAQQDWQTQQQELRIKALREALPLLQMQRAGSMPNLLAPGSTAAAGGGGAGGAAPAGDSYESSIAGIEGGPGKNPRSSAAGIGQFTDGTWRDFAAANPDLFKGMTPAQIMAAKTDPTLSPVLGPKAITWLARRNAGNLDMSGVPPTGPLLGIAHYVGAGPAAAIASAPDSAPVRNYVSPEAVQANSELGTMTVGQMKARYANVPNPGFLAPAKGTQVAWPGAGPTGAPAAPGSAPPSASTAPAPGTPNADLTWEQFRTLHGGLLTADEKAAATITPDPQLLQQAEASMQTAAQNLQLARSTGNADASSKAQADFEIARKNLADLKQTAAQNTIANIRAAQEAKDKPLIDLYKQAQEQAATAAENDKQRAAALQIENVKAGNNYHQQLDKESAEFANTNTIKPMSEQGLKAHQMNLSLAQLLPLLKDLPPGGGALGALLSSNPELGWLTTAAGITDPKQTDAVRLVNGLVANISTQMKPTGLGALREYEWDAFKSQLPNMLSTTDGQQKAVAILMHMNDRIQQEAAWMNNYYNRKVPDEYAKTPGAMRTAHNLDVPDGSKYLSPQQMMDEKLGPVIPQYTGPPGASGQAQWEQSLPPGQPYYKTVARRDPKNPNQPMRDSSGNVVTTKTYEVRPWQ